MPRVPGFACRFAVAYGIFVLLWVTTLEERYNDYLAWSCTRLLSLLEEPKRTSGIKRDGELLIVDHVPHFAHVISFVHQHYALRNVGQ